MSLSDDILRSQAHRITSLDIDAEGRASYYFADPVVDGEATVTGDSVLTQKVSDAMEHYHRGGLVNQKPMTFKAAMEVADHPRPYAKETVFEALDVLKRHILVNDVGPHTITVRTATGEDGKTAPFDAQKEIMKIKDDIASLQKQISGPINRR